jgi:hypothetical protein
MIPAGRAAGERRGGVYRLTISIDLKAMILADQLMLTDPRL